MNTAASLTGREVCESLGIDPYISIVEIIDFHQAI